MENIPDAVRRFLLANIPSVPHLELLVLLVREQKAVPLREIAGRLYLGIEPTRSLADFLQQRDLLVCTGAETEFAVRREPGLDELLALLERTYSRQVRAVSEFVHGNLGRSARDEFGHEFHST